MLSLFEKLTRNALRAVDHVEVGHDVAALVDHEA
jgi:hypothetical protein